MLPEVPEKEMSEKRSLPDVDSYAGTTDDHPERLPKGMAA
jgi:hypothetical protein